jgi:hypothetical protein
LINILINQGLQSHLTSTAGANGLGVVRFSMPRDARQRWRDRPGLFSTLRIVDFEASICIAGISKNSLHARCPAQLKTLNISSQDMSRHAGELKNDIGLSVTKPDTGRTVGQQRICASDITLDRENPSTA